MSRKRSATTQELCSVVGAGDQTKILLEGSLAQLLYQRKIPELMAPLAERNYTKYALWEAVQSVKYKNNLSDLALQLGVEPMSGTYWKVMRLFRDLQKEPDPMLESDSEVPFVILPTPSTPATATDTATDTTATTSTTTEKKGQVKVCHRCHHRFIGGHKAHGEGKCEPCRLRADECPYERHSSVELKKAQEEKEPVSMSDKELKHVNDRIEAAIHYLTSDELVSYLKAHSGTENYEAKAQDYLTQRQVFWKSIVPLLHASTLKLTAKEIAKKLQETAARRSKTVESAPTQHQPATVPKELIVSATAQHQPRPEPVPIPIPPPGPSTSSIVRATSR